MYANIKDERNEVREEHLRNLYNRFGRVEMIAIANAADYTGLTVKVLKNDRTFPLKKVCGRLYVTVVAFAKWLSEVMT